jgi:hypothetical protein
MCYLCIKYHAQSKIFQQFLCMYVCMYVCMFQSKVYICTLNERTCLLTSLPMYVSKKIFCKWYTLNTCKCKCKHLFVNFHMINFYRLKTQNIDKKIHISLGVSLRFALCHGQSKWWNVAVPFFYFVTIFLLPYHFSTSFPFFCFVTIFLFLLYFRMKEAYTIQHKLRTDHRNLITDIFGKKTLRRVCWSPPLAR